MISKITQNREKISVILLIAIVVLTVSHLFLPVYSNYTQLLDRIPLTYALSDMGEIFTLFGYIIILVMVFIMLLVGQKMNWVVYSILSLILFVSAIYVYQVTNADKYIEVSFNLFLKAIIALIVANTFVYFSDKIEDKLSKS